MNKKVININKINLDDLKSLLSPGDIKKIAESTGYSENYVSRVLNPKDKRLNKKIIQEALRLAEGSKLVTVSESLAKAVSA